MDDSAQMFLEALRDVAQARQMAKVARDAGVTRESLYRATSEIGNPTLDTFVSILRALHLKFTIEPEDSSPSLIAPTSSTAAVREEVPLATQENAAAQITEELSQAFYRPEILTPPTPQRFFTLPNSVPPPYVIAETQRKGDYAN